MFSLCVIISLESRFIANCAYVHINDFSISHFEFHCVQFALCTSYYTYCDAHRSKKKKNGERETQNKRFRYSGICEERSGGKIEPAFHSQNINYYYSNRMIFTVEPNSIKKILLHYQTMSAPLPPSASPQKLIFLQLLCGAKMKRNKYKRWNEK